MIAKDDQQRLGFCAMLTDNALRRVFAEQRQAVLRGASGALHQAALSELDWRGIDYRTTTPLHVQTSAQPEPTA